MKYPNETLRQSTPLEMSSFCLSQSAKHIHQAAGFLLRSVQFLITDVKIRSHRKVSAEKADSR